MQRYVGGIFLQQS